MATEPTADVLAGLTRLNSEYWYRVDNPGKAEVADLYTEDGRMIFTAFRLEGRKTIRNFFGERNSSVPKRTTRHISTNLCFEALDSGDIRMRSIVTVYAGMGELPLATGVPTSVVDFTDICSFSQDRWLYRERSGIAIFIGPGAASFLTSQLPVGHPLKTPAMTP